jgi:uncharacterized SAM-binding protein YcdF (DUF218 family)
MVIIEEFEARRRDWRLCLIGLIVIAVVVIGFISGPLLLRGVARLWLVSDSLDQADAIVVLGGGLDVRPAAAADLYKRRLAPQILVGFSHFDQGRDAELNSQMLLQHDVPTTAILYFGFQPHSTYGEARGILEWAKTSGAKSVIVPTDFFPTRRVRWIFNRELAPAGVRVIVQAHIPPRYSVDNWWQHKSGWTDFGKELMKMAYYRLRY